MLNTMNDMKLSVVFIIFFELFRGIYMAQLPDNWIRCNLTDPNINDCMKQATLRALNQLRDEGLASLGVKSLDPMEAGGVSIDDGGDLIHLTVNLTNFKIYGATHFTIKDYHFNVTNYRMKISLFIPNITYSGRYKMRGSALFLPLTGEGRFEVSMYDTEQIHDIQQTIVQRNGENYFHVDSYKITNTPVDIKINFEKLFSGGNTQLAASGNNFLNVNWRGIYDQTVPTLNKAFNNAYEFVYRNVIENIPVDSLFLS